MISTAYQLLSKEERRSGIMHGRGKIPENFRMVGFVPDTPEWRAKAERLARTGRMDEPEDEGRESAG
ncbi:MAG TPA: hypothetical protein VN238_10985 [Solirubrobacteraceae bacterium]|nr:hypothetical protein [Solirubrobacteraceae bacterium]